MDPATVDELQILGGAWSCLCTHPSSLQAKHHFLPPQTRGLSLSNCSGTALSSYL